MIDIKTPRLRTEALISLGSDIDKGEAIEPMDQVSESASLDHLLTMCSVVDGAFETDTIWARSQ